MLGTSTNVKITSVGRWSVFGEVIGNPEPVKENTFQSNTTAITTQPDSCISCTCSREPEPCPLTSQNCSQSCCMESEAPNDSIIIDSSKPGNWRSRTLVNSIQCLLLRKKMRGPEKMTNEHEIDKQGRRARGRLATLDWILVAGMFASFIIIVALLFVMTSS